MNVQQIKANVPISRYLEDKGYHVKGNRCVAKWRGGERESVAIDDAKGEWCDHGDGDRGGDVIALCSLVEGLEFLPACKALCARYGIEDEPRLSNKPKEIRHYDYTDENGKPLFCVIRYEPKDFRQAHYDANGKRVYNMKDVRLVPYHLPCVLEAIRNGARIFFCEGEKDADALERIGLVATCNVGGASGGDKIFERLHETFRLFEGAQSVTIIADRDNAEKNYPGQRHAERVRKALKELAGVNASIVYVGDTSCKDASDWIDKGATAEDFNALADEPPPWTPPFVDAPPVSDEPLRVALSQDEFVSETPQDTEEEIEENEGLEELDWNETLHELKGLVGDIARYAYSTMIRPQPKFAVLIGFITVAAIFNRTIHDAANNLAHIFVLGVCPNGGGKDPVLKLPKEIIRAAFERLGWFANLTMAKAHSESAIADEISHNHAITMLIDEVSGFFKQAKASERNGASLSTVKGALKELYSYQLGQTYDGAKNARIKGKSLERIRVDTPCVSFVGVSQDDVLPDAFQEEDVRDGLIPRIVFFISQTRPKKNFDAIERRPQLPEELIEQVAAIFSLQNWKPASKDEPKLFRYADNFKSRLIEADEDARLLQREYGEFCDKQFEAYEAQGKLTSSIWVRADENARRFALIYAAGRGYDQPEHSHISLEDVTIATNIITACAKDACCFLEGRIADEKFDKLKLRLLTFIERSPDKARTQTEITRGKYGDPKTRQAALEDLKAAGLVSRGNISRRGRIAVAYSITKIGQKALAIK